MPSDSDALLLPMVCTYDTEILESHVLGLLLFAAKRTYLGRDALLVTA